MAPAFSERKRFQVARQALAILFEIFLEGYAHSDFHAGNLYWVKGQLIATDFEAMQPYRSSRRPAFPESYDITGKGLESPFRTNNMCYLRAKSAALGEVLEIPLDIVLQDCAARLKAELRDACQTFQSSGRRHRCRAGRIYSSFSLPYLTVSASEAQRNSARRFENLQVSRANLEHKSVLDLGSNVGAMLFEANKWKPRRSLGIEYDVRKVQIARRIAAYNGLNRVEFLQADVDLLTTEGLGNTFDVVMCLAIEAHVKNPRRLYALLAGVTSQVLYFEGNSSTDPSAVRANLLEAGFDRVEILGTSDDDCIPNNNNRPLLIAFK
ncbi:methyltransferase domain-containing protein [Chloroflexota bacterium]